MRSDRLAEWVLSLVADGERAASAVGDFLEEVPQRGRWWLWMSVGRTGLSWMGRSLAEAPVRMAGFAAFAWFAYMVMALLLGFAGWIAATVVWGMGYFFSHHTGMELVTNALRLRFDWPAPPLVWLRFVDCAIVWMAAPYQSGRFVGRAWRGREMVIWLYLASIWPLLMVFVPFASRYARASITAAPLILAFVLVGMLKESWKARRSVAIHG